MNNIEQIFDEIHNGINLDKHIEADNWEITAAVALQGYGLERLAEHEDWYVRVCVVRACDPQNPEHRAILDNLLYDEHEAVRHAILKEHEYGAEVLINDDSKKVRDTARELKAKEEAEKKTKGKGR